jgi:putative spermidine/putrescine transport system ATP-binding protein
MGLAAIRLTGVTKVFPGDVRAVDAVDLEVTAGEFFSVLGPSGSGKTTLLRLIAGFETPTAGRIVLDGTDVTATPPYDRDVNTVFQDYALFPHMTVAQNVAYGLMVRRVPKAERRARTAAALATVRLEGLGDRRPARLSGGQRQRVALARALALSPRLVIADEPTSALDVSVQAEVLALFAELQKELGFACVFISHDLAVVDQVSDRVAVLRAGELLEQGRPRQVFGEPRHPYTRALLDSVPRVPSSGLERFSPSRRVHTFDEGCR